MRKEDVKGDGEGRKWKESVWRGEEARTNASDHWELDKSSCG